MKLKIVQGGTERNLKAAAVLLLLIAGTVFMAYQAIADGKSATVLYVLIGIFALLAIIAISFRRIAIFDKTKNQIETSFNVFGLAIKAIDKLDEARKLEFMIGEKIDYSQTGSSQTARIIYTLNLIYENEQGEVRLHIYNSGNEEKARDNLKKVAEFMGMEPVIVDYRDGIQKTSQKVNDKIFK